MDDIDSRDDGTAISWDSECLRTPIDCTELAGWACIVMFFALAALGVIGCLQGWWSA